MNTKKKVERETESGTNRLHEEESRRKKIANKFGLSNEEKNLIKALDEIYFLEGETEEEVEERKDPVPSDATR